MQNKQDHKSFKAKTVTRNLLVVYVLNKVQIKASNNLLH